MSEAFETPIEICGPLRAPRQMLGDQEYDGHASLHDDATAERLGFSAGPIEGPTHFSQFDPLAVSVWGREWFETGCISAHYRNMVFEGEEVRAFFERPTGGARQVRIRAEKADGTEVLIGTASVGGDNPPTELENRIAGLRPPGPLVILHGNEVGMKGAVVERVRMDHDQHMGDLYPFSLAQKLEVITESSPWYGAAGGDSPWGRGVVPIEMISVLMQYTSHQAGWPTRGPAIGLFAGLQIRLVDGPVFVGEDYEIEREIIALSESRRVESRWVLSTLRRASDAGVVAEMIVNSATLKESYEPYDRELAELMEAGAAP